MGLLGTTSQQTYQNSGDLGSYQYTSLEDIINNFIVGYVGENKLIGKVRRTDVAFHAQRGLAELSYDTLRSRKSQEIEIAPSLKMMLPQDYVNYVKISWHDTNGMERILYPALNTSNPTAILQDGNYDYSLDSGGNLQVASESDTWKAFKATTPSSTGNLDADSDYYADMFSGRFGLSPEKTQANGNFYIDYALGFIHFSSNLNGETVTLKYVSDSLGVDGDQIVHKFAEEALYKHIAYALISASATVQEHVIRRFKKEKFAATRQAKLRLSNIKLEEIAQVMRNKSKRIKH
jgi:hypothetical protein|tara:strand:- start:6884 stop:7759 length:876 start_codon:yes stop_codon:yes gene_type:complete